MDYKVNIYKNSKDSSSNEKVDLLTFLTTDKYKDKIMDYRDQYNAYKVRLLRWTDGDKPKKPPKVGIPMVTISGTFSYRDKAHLEDYSRLICVDVDNIDDVDRVFNELKKYANVWFMGRSASGAGLMVIIRLDCGVERHLDAYYKLEEWFKEELSVDIDAACKDVSRARYASYDPDYYHNADATVMSVPPCLVKEPKGFKKVSAFRTSVDSDDNFKQWLNLVDKYQSEFVDGNGWRWLTHKAFEAKDRGIPESQVKDTLLQLSDGVESDRWINYQVSKIYTK
ncbi:MAG: hypothetical protein K0U41_05555 [Gammaproteobacteria bacterium]|nr:hypothetical protein [Gammaproteobacteria bacterium]